MYLNVPPLCFLDLYSPLRSFQLKANTSRVHFILLFIFSSAHTVCPQLLSVLFPSLCCVALWCCWGCSRTPLQLSHRTVVGSASEKPGLILILVFLFKHGQTRSVKEKAPTATLLSLLCPLSDVSTSQPVRITKVNHHHRP